jgi:CheY-like chemotaxis protein
MARILFVDDEQVEIKCAVLALAGHTMTPASSAREAIEKLRNNDYDAVVTDWLLGDADGRVVVEAAKDKSNGSIQVVVVTAFIRNAYTAPEPVADLYLEKPVDPEELILIVNELLKKR